MNEALRKVLPQTIGEWLIFAAMALFVLAGFGLHWIVGVIILAIILMIIGANA